MQDKKIIFMGTPSIAGEYLNTLITNNIKVEAVFTQPPKRKSRGMKLSISDVHSIADKNKINVFHPQVFDALTIKSINNINPDLIIVMAYGKILPKEVLELPKYGCINIHVSILPRWRGAAPIEHTLMNGDIKTGVSIIKLVEKLDAGPIITQDMSPIPIEYNKLKLSNFLTSMGKNLLIKTLPKIFNNEIVLKVQNENNATYANKITPEIRKINFHNSVKNVINHIRAHAPKPGAWFYLNKQRIKIIEAKPGTAIGKASTILNEKFEIGCNDGSIKPLIIQKEGKKVITISEFLRGYKFKTDNRINAQL